MDLPIDEIDAFIEAFYLVCVHKKRAKEIMASSNVPLVSGLVN
jgi:hypothetical protein